MSIMSPLPSYLPYKATSQHLVWCTVKRRHDHPFIGTSSSPTSHLDLSVVDTSSPGNGSWTVYSHLFHGTANEHALSQQPKLDFFKILISYSRKNILFILKENKKTWHILNRRITLGKRINLPSVIPIETQFLAEEAVFLVMIASNTFENYVISQPMLVFRIF